MRRAGNQAVTNAGLSSREGWPYGRDAGQFRRRPIKRQNHYRLCRGAAPLLLVDGRHCGGLRRTQRLGDYVLAHAYARLDHVLDHDLSLEVPIPEIAEVQLALTAAVAKVSGLGGPELKQHLRTGNVVTTDDHDWELRYDELSTFFNQSRAIAVDMESATIAANGFRLRLPYGTLLCVSEKPLHGEIKLPGMPMPFTLRVLTSIYASAWKR